MSPEEREFFEREVSKLPPLTQAAQEKIREIVKEYALSKVEQEAS